MLDDLYLRGIIYDIEIYRNLFMVTLFSLRMKKYKTFMWYKSLDQRKEFIELIKDRFLIGFNNWFFDDAITNKIIDTIDSDIEIYELWEFAQGLINGEQNPYRWNSKIHRSYDILELIRAGFSVISLKNLGVNLKCKNIQDLPIPFDAEITDEDIEKLKNYNINDLDITNEAFEFCKPALEMRELLSESYGLELHSLSDSGIGKELFRKLYVDRIKQKNKKINEYEVRKGRTFREEIDFEEVIFKSIKFKTPELQEYLKKLKEIKLIKPDSEEIYSELGDNNE